PKKEQTIDLKQLPLLQYTNISGMKSLSLLPLFSLLLLSALSQNIMLYKNPSLPVETRVNDLLSRMSTEEKFWQMFMIPCDSGDSIEKFSNGIFGLQWRPAGKPDTAGLKTGRNPVLQAREMTSGINFIQKFFVEKTRLGIPVIFFEEALHGLMAEGATSFPQSIALAATWDTSLMSRVAGCIAQETKSRGIRQVLSPVVNIASDVRWGRIEETYGEDPLLASRMGVAYVSPFEKAGVVTTPKHFLANLGDGGRDSYPADFSERLLEEVYITPFRACFVQGGSRSVMTSYNSLNGSPCSANNWLLHEKLNKEMHFSGYNISDACAVGGANVLHHTASDYADASAKAINNGLDVIFQTEYEHYKLFIPPFLDGRIDMKTIDSAVARVLRIKFQLGLFEHPYVDENEAGKWNGNPGHKLLAREAAAKSFVLLKNEKNILPLKKNLQTIAVIGPDAVEARLGGYSGQGNNPINILTGIKNKLGDACQVLYSPGCGRQSSEWAVIPSSALFTEMYGKTENGLKGDYFNTIDLDGNPVLTRKDNELNFRWTLYSPDPKINYDFFSVRWTGKLKAPATGRFRIGLDGNDGYRLYLDGKLLINNWKKESYATRLTEFDFEKEREYDIRIEFFESSGSVCLKLVWNMGMVNDWQARVADAVGMVEKSDVAIVVAGIIEGEGFDRARLNLPGHQEEMINRIALTGKPVIVVLVGGSAITMSNWVDHVNGILDIWYPGEEGGNAVADVLFGDFNPAGRLPVTFPVTEGQLPLVYNHKPTGRNDDYGDLTGQPLFPFGFGLSYTKFEYSNLRFDKYEFAAYDSATVRFKVRNTGHTDGEEAVQLYIRDEISSVSRPIRELRGFQRIFLKAEEEKEVGFTITPELLRMLNEQMEWVVEPGDFRIMIGASSKDIRLRGVVTVNPEFTDTGRRR
ncbi:MAG: glycoside hydrolase family 3 C-terminal domain-containing protein, partial [Bacteroidota bacterium]